MRFEDQFNSFYPTILAIAGRYAKTTNIPFEEYESSLCEEFYLKYNSFDPNRSSNFNSFMRVVLTQRASRVASRRERRFYDNVIFYESLTFDEDGESQEFDLPMDWDLEDRVISEMEKKTDADKRQLIDALTANTDPLTTAIVNEYLNNLDATFTSVGKKLGIHPQTVKRKLAYLSRKFNENLYGEISAYLAS